MNADLHVAHGFTMADLHEMAAAACRADRSLASDAHTRYSVAWSAIAEALTLATEDEPPTRADLVRVGWQAIYREVREMRVMFGFKDRDGTNGVATAPRYVQYWTVRHSDPEDGLIERIAVGQVLATLSEPYRDAVVALAVHGDYQAAAAYGRTLSTHCAAEHEWTPENTRWEKSRRGVGHARVRRCRACEAATSKTRRSSKTAAA